jgi:hypothetical protein
MMRLRFVAAVFCVAYATAIPLVSDSVFVSKGITAKVILIRHGEKPSSGKILDVHHRTQWRG